MIHKPRRRNSAKPRFGLSGRLKTVLIDIKTGIVRRTVNHNIITRVGLATIPPSIFQAREFYVTQLGVGSGITTPTDLDSSLTTEVLVKAITESLDESNLTGATPYVIVTVQFNPSEANGNLSEAGLFDSDDNMFNHALFGAGSITNATQANPCVITSADHGLSNSDRIRIDGVLGMTQLNFSGANYYYVSVLSSSTFALYTDEGLSSGVDATGYSAYSSAGTWTISIPKTSSQILQVSFEIQAENA